VATDLSWREACEPMTRLFRRTPARGWTTRELILWALSKHTQHNPRELVAWLELAGVVAWGDGRWWLKGARPRWDGKAIGKALSKLARVKWSDSLRRLEKATQALVDLVDDADNPPPSVLGVERAVVLAYQARDINAVRAAARSGIEVLKRERRR
jgi:hypothetical protein